MNKLPRVTLLFWIMKIAATTLGETAGDLLSMTLKIGYAVSSMVLIGLLVVSLVTQLRSKRYHPWLYWTAILFSNTLGTALGDFLADNSGLGFAGGALLIAGLLALTAFATFSTRISKALLFWIAFVLTRPFGATMGDVLTKSTAKGGLNVGTVGSSFVLGVILVMLILYTTFYQHKETRVVAKAGY